MTRNGIAIDSELPVAPLTPDSLKNVKKQDMKQAIIERFSYRAKAAVAPQTATPAKMRSPYWQPVDEEC